MADQAWQEWFEDACAVREESLYPELFGDIGAGIYPLDAELFTTAFQQKSIEPRWLFEECLSVHQVEEGRPGGTYLLAFRIRGKQI